MNTISRMIMALIAVSPLIGCDDTDAFDTGGTPGPVPSDASFPLAQGLADFIAGAHVYTYGASGNANGTAITGAGTMTFGAAAGATFEGQSALSQTRSIVGTLTDNGTTIPDTLAGLYYYTTNYDPLGSSDINGGIYCVADGNPVYPPIVRVGDSATIATYACYEDNTKATLISEDTERYSAGADTAESAIIEIVTTSEFQNILQTTVRDRYRINETGDLEWLSLTVTDETTSPPSTITYTAD
jgi:hypothetical protein